MEENKRVITQFKDDIQIIRIRGRLTYDDIGHYKEAIRGAIAPAEGYVIDLQEVEQIDSTGIGLLVNTAKHFISNHNKMVIINTNDFIQELFEVSKLNLIFEIYDDLGKGLGALSVPDEEYWSKVTLY